MQILSYPFKRKATITIKNDYQLQQLDCELATTDIEIFQSLNFRKKEDFVKPLLLVFENPSFRSFTRINFSFPVEQVKVDFSTKEVKEIELIYPSTSKHKEVSLKSYTHCGMVLLVPKGGCKQHNIQLKKTYIAIS